MLTLAERCSGILKKYDNRLRVARGARGADSGNDAKKQEVQLR